MIGLAKGTGPSWTSMMGPVMLKCPTWTSMMGLVQIKVQVEPPR